MNAADSRAQQGLPPKITDPATIANVATLMSIQGDDAPDRSTTTRSPQPAKGHLALRRITNRYIARKYAFSEQYVSAVLNGRVPASERIRTAVSEELGLPEDELFRPAAVDAGRPGGTR